MSKIIKNTMLIMAALYFLLGIALLIWQSGSLNVICYILGAACVIYGVIRLTMFFSNAQAPKANSGIAIGALNLILGCVLLFQASAVVTIFAVIIGIALIVDNIFKLQSALDMKRLGYEKWKALLISALIMLAIGIILLFNPAQNSAFIAIVIGLSLIADAVLNIICIMTVSKLAEASDIQKF